MAVGSVVLRHGVWIHLVLWIWTSLTEKTSSWDDGVHGSLLLRVHNKDQLMMCSDSRSFQPDRRSPIFFFFFQRDCGLLVTRLLQADADYLWNVTADC